MKIVYCIAGIFNSGGMERVLSLKANYLASKGYEVTIITTDQKGRVPFFSFSNEINYIDLNINYCDTSTNLLVKVCSYVKKQTQHRQRLKKVLHELKADIVVSMFDHEATQLYKIKDGSKKILEIHFSRFKRIQYGRKFIWGFVDKIRAANDESLAKKYDRFVVLTKEDMGYWQNIENIVHIPNAYSFEPNRVADLEQKKVIAVGRLDYQKGFSQLIDAWSLVKKEYIDWKLYIYGSGPLKEELEAQIIRLNLKEQVSIKAPVDNIIDKYLESSFLVMSSRYEGLPMALLEGQVCGLPLVAFACKCGPRDLIFNGENGFLLEEGDQKGFAEALEILMTNHDLRKSMGIKSKEFSKIYSLENIMTQWEDMFKELI